MAMEMERELHLEMHLEMELEQEIELEIGQGRAEDEARAGYTVGDGA